ncbi:MAG: hypothetical protein HN712_00300 [Gemmatimonadetes bacterium]|nr:hypothetical protein [Gemmatimonadota bacterium]MBT7858708.1 hypothetical protein [Gemmatimonadota bacterium]
MTATDTRDEEPQDEAPQDEAPGDVSGIQHFLTFYLYGAYFLKGGQLTQHEAIDHVVAIAKVGDKVQAMGKDVMGRLWGGCQQKDR